MDQITEHWGPGVIHGCFCCGVTFDTDAEHDAHFVSAEHQDAWTVWRLGAMQRMGMLPELEPESR